MACEKGDVAFDQWWRAQEQCQDLEFLRDASLRAFNAGWEARLGDLEMEMSSYLLRLTLKVIEAERAGWALGFDSVTSAGPEPRKAHLIKAVHESSPTAYATTNVDELLSGTFAKKFIKTDVA